MEEMNLLTALRAEVPLAPPSPAAERLFRTGLTSGHQPERGHPSPSRLRFLPGVAGARGRPRWWRLAIPGVLAAGLAAALVVLLLPPGAGAPASPVTTDPVSGGTTMSAQLLADVAGQAALSQRPVKPTQWVYQELESYDIPVTNPKYKSTQVQTQWVLADGADMQWGPVKGHMIGGLILTGPDAAGDQEIMAQAASAYTHLSSLPKNPAALEYYFAHQGQFYKGGATGPHQGKTPLRPQPEANPPQYQRALRAYSTIQNMLSSEILPPSLVAELYHALADVPGIVAKKNVKDIAGQSAVEFILPASPVNENLGTFLSATTYQYLGQANWYGHPPYTVNSKGQYSGSYGEEVLLDQALVSAPGKLP